MLSELVPGLREFRTPVVVGYLWLAAAYLAAFQQIEQFGDRQADIRAATGNLHELVGNAFLLSVATLLAWLIGTVSTRVTGLLDALLRKGDEASLIARVTSERSDVGEPMGWLRRVLTLVAFTSSIDSRVHLGASISEEPLRRVIETLEMLEIRPEAPTLRQIVRELSGGASVDRLLEHNKDLYMEYDRHRTEGEFRLAVAWPVLAFSIVVAVRLDAPWPLKAIGVVIVVLMLVVLYFEGMWRRRAALDTVAYAVADEILVTPTIGRLRRAGFHERELRQSQHSSSGYK